MHPHSKLLKGSDLNVISPKKRANFSFSFFHVLALLVTSAYQWYLLACNQLKKISPPAQANPNFHIYSIPLHIWTLVFCTFCIALMSHVTQDAVVIDLRVHTNSSGCK
jgi:hypothetical protein